MIQSRIREIRKKKGLTLQEVAKRAGTTAQTIGRLETGMRNLSLKWVRRIAEALEADPAELLAIPESGDIEISAEITKTGQIRHGNLGTISPRLAAKDPVAINIRQNMGEYRAGDIVVCELEGSDDPEQALGKDCLVKDSAGNFFFAKILSNNKKDHYLLVPLNLESREIIEAKVAFAAPAVMLLRELK